MLSPPRQIMRRLPLVVVLGAARTSSAHRSSIKVRVEEQEVGIAGNLQREVAELSEQVSLNFLSDERAAKAILGAEKMDYQKTAADDSESVSVLSRAIQLLQSKSLTANPVETLQASLLSQHARKSTTKINFLRTLNLLLETGHRMVLVGVGGGLILA